MPDRDSAPASQFGKFDDLDEAERELMLKTMHTRVTEHNIQAVAAYYSRISMARLATLLALEVEPMETQLCDMAGVWSHVSGRGLRANGRRGRNSARHPASEHRLFARRRMRGVRNARL